MGQRRAGPLRSVSLFLGLGLVVAAANAAYAWVFRDLQAVVAWGSLDRPPAIHSTSLLPGRDTARDGVGRFGRGGRHTKSRTGKRFRATHRYLTKVIKRYSGPMGGGRRSGLCWQGARFRWPILCRRVASNRSKRDQSVRYQPEPAGREPPARSRWHHYAVLAFVCLNDASRAARLSGVVGEQARRSALRHRPRLYVLLWP